MTHDIERFVKLGIPRSTVKDWIKKGLQSVITLPELKLAAPELVKENLSLKHKIDTLTARQDLVAKTLVILGFQIQFKRLPSETAKVEILSAIKSAAADISLAACLEVIGLSAARYHTWLKRQVKCLLQDQNSCPANRTKN